MHETDVMAWAQKAEKISKVGKGTFTYAGEPPQLLRRAKLIV